MLTNIYGAKCVGIEAVPVTVEVDITAGLGIHLVGLADAAVKESLLRTITALQSMGFKIPGRKIVINLAPADMHKKGSGYDVPIALGIIAASGQKEMPLIGRYIIMGELGLDGSIRDIRGHCQLRNLHPRKGLPDVSFLWNRQTEPQNTAVRKYMEYATFPKPSAFCQEKRTAEAS